MTNNDAFGQVEGVSKPRLATPLLLTEAQAADVLSLSPRKLWELAARGAIPFVKIGAVKRYRVADLQKWVDDGCTGAGAGAT